MNGNTGGICLFEQIGKAVKITVGRLPLPAAYVFGIGEDFGGIERVRSRTHLKENGVETGLRSVFYNIVQFRLQLILGKTRFGRIVDVDSGGNPYAAHFLVLNGGFGIGRHGGLQIARIFCFIGFGRNRYILTKLRKGEKADGCKQCDGQKRRQNGFMPVLTAFFCFLHRFP